MKRTITLALSTLIVFAADVLAQVDLRVSGAQAGFPVAVPQLCDQSNGSPYNIKIPETISKDLDLSGFFNVISSAAYIEAPGKCVEPDKVAFSDWSVIGAEGLVRGTVSADGDAIRVEMYLYDVLQQRAVLGKRYEGRGGDAPKIAHKFANEVVKYFTGTAGVFGTSIAFVSKVGRFKEIFVMGLDGSDLRQLTRDRGLAVSPSWSPSGDSIIYTSYRTRKPELYIVSPSGGNARQITDRPGLEIGAKLMGNGNIISAATFEGVSNLVAFDMRGKLLQRLTSSSAIDVSPSVSPDGGRVVFCSNRSGGPQIYTMPSGGGEIKRISFTGSNYCTSPAWSPKGDKIAFTCMAGGNQIFVVSPEGGQAVQMTFGGNNEDPTWSPDGRYLVFSAGTSGNRNLSVLPLHSGKPKSISVTRSEDSQPAWSPLP